MTQRRFPLPTLLATALPVASLVLAGLVVAPPAAHAAPVFVDANTDVDLEMFAFDLASCSETLQVEPPDVSGPLVENAAPVSQTGSASVTGTAVDPSDVMTIKTTGTTSAGITSSGANPRSIDASLAATVTATSTKPTSACELHSGAEASGDFQFTVAQAGFLTVHVTRRGGASSEFDLERDLPVSDGEQDHFGDHLDVDESSRIFLTPGTYEGNFDLELDLSTSVAATVTGSVAVHATFAVAGTQSAAAAGKGKGFLTMPSARSCATHDLASNVTGKKKAAKKIKQITFFVNDAKVKTVKHPKKGATISVPVADGTDAELRAVVQLLPKKKGKPGKEEEVSASYVACTS